MLLGAAVAWAQPENAIQDAAAAASRMGIIRLVSNYLPPQSCVNPSGWTIHSVKYTTKPISV